MSGKLLANVAAAAISTSPATPATAPLGREAVYFPASFRMDDVANAPSSSRPPTFFQHQESFAGRELLTPVTVNALKRVILDRNSSLEDVVNAVVRLYRSASTDKTLPPLNEIHTLLSTNKPPATTNSIASRLVEINQNEREFYQRLKDAGLPPAATDSPLITK